MGYLVFIAFLFAISASSLYTESLRPLLQLLATVSNKYNRKELTTLRLSTDAETLRNYNEVKQEYNDAYLVIVLKFLGFHACLCMSGIILIGLILWGLEASGIVSLGTSVEYPLMIICGWIFAWTRGAKDIDQHKKILNKTSDVLDTYPDKIS